MAQNSVNQATVNVVFCMGSSCFSRGGNRALAMLQEYLKQHDLESRVHIEGTLCQGCCQDGPNVTINGTMYSAADPGVVLDLIRHHIETTK